MPIVKSQEEKSELHIAAQVPNLEKNSTQLIMALDISGKGTNEIAQYLGMTAGRISIIKGSPLYKEERTKRFEALQREVSNRTATSIVSDPARDIINSYKEVAAKKLVGLVTDAKNEFLQKSAAVDVLEFGGIHKDKKDKAAGVTVVIEEKIAERFGFAKDYQPPTVATQRTITIETQA